MATASREKGGLTGPPALLGIDIGSSAAKAVVFDLDGSCLASRSVDLPTSVQTGGRVERDAELSWTLTAQAIREALAVAQRPILSVGLTGCGNGAVFVDATGLAIRPAILSADTRALDLVTSEDATLQKPYPGQTRWLLNWLRSAEPETAARLSTVLFWKDYVRLRLTGVRSTDPTDACASGLLDVRSRAYRFDDPALPQLAEPTTTGGYVTALAAEQTGLAVGAPVSVGCIDFEAAAIGAGLPQPETLSVVAGSWSMNHGYTSTLPSNGASGLFLWNATVDPLRWAAVEGSATSANHFDWAVRRIAGHGDFNGAALAAEAAGPTQAVFVPGLFSGRATFADIGVMDDLASLLRAVMEGVVFAHRRHIETLAAEGVVATTVRLAGGATASRFWSQLFADILEMPVETPRTAEVGALGAAVLAGVCTGQWGSVAEAQAQMTGQAERFIPRESYGPSYRRFLNVAGALT